MGLKIYTDLELIKYGYPVEMLVPFIGSANDEDKPGKMMNKRFEEYAILGKAFIELTNLEKADVCLLPIYYQLKGDVKSFENAIISFVQRVEDSGKTIIVFAGYDIQDFSINIKNCIIFSGAINKSNQLNNVYSWPHFFEDYIKYYQCNSMIVRQKAEMPIVGFCGYAPPLNLKFGKKFIISWVKLIANYLGIMKKLPALSSHSYRARAIIALKKSKKVFCNLKIKSNFAFGPYGQLNTGKTTETDNAFRINFVKNIIESDYTLCARGIGNNSIRFFETICCGRIPVFVNTDSSLPFDHIINWKNLCVWVEEKDIDKIGDIISNFHEKISEEDFIKLQKELRRIWAEYLSPLGFFKNLKLFLN